MTFETNDSTNGGGPNILHMAPDCFTNMFSFLLPKHLAILSVVNSTLREMVFERTREIKSEKSVVSRDFLAHFTQLNALEVVNVKRDFKLLTDQVIEKQKCLKVLRVERVDDRASNVLDLSEMHGLESLEVNWAKFMHGVQLSGESVSKHLTHLTLHNMAFSDFYYNQFEQTCGGHKALHLTHLDLSYCQNIKDPQIADWAPNVTHINISRTGIMNQTIYHIIENCHKLRVLVADLNENLGNGHLMIRNHDKLEVISLNLCRRVYDLSIFGCPSLKKIDISKTPIQNSHLCKLFKDNAHVPEILIKECYKAFEDENFTLEVVRVASQGSPSSSSSPATPPHGASLKSLSPGSDSQQKKFLPLKLRKLNASCTLMNSAMWEEFLQAATDTLEELDLSMTQITNLTLPDTFSLPLLRVIDVTSTNIQNSALELLLSISPNLEELVAKICVVLTEDIVLASASMKKMDLSGSPISNKSLQHILSRCPQLEHLVISSALEELDLASDSLKYFSCGGCTTLSRFSLGSCPQLETLIAHSLVSLVRFNVSEEGQKAPLKRVELNQSPQVIGRAMVNHFPNADIHGFKLKKDILDIENPTFEELRQGFRKYQNLHSTHILLSLAEKTRKMIEQNEGGDVEQMRELLAKMCLQVGHYRSIQGRNLEEGVELVNSSLQYFYECIKLGIPETYFRIKYAYEVLLALYGSMENKEAEFLEITQKLHEWVEKNKLEDDKKAAS